MWFFIALLVVALFAARAVYLSLPERTWAGFVKSVKEDERNYDPDKDSYGPSLT
jgi:hypothetical protein